MPPFYEYTSNKDEQLASLRQFIRAIRAIRIIRDLKYALDQK